MATTPACPIVQLDVTNTFFHINLNEEVCMTQPRGVVDPSQFNHVCRLLKALYGLKQVPWYATLSNYFIHLAFQHSIVDPSLIFHKDNILTYLIIYVYVDDLQVTGNHNSFISNLISTLHNSFHMKNLGHIHHFLGFHIVHTPNGLHLNLFNYAA